MTEKEITVRDETSPMMMAQNFLNNGGDLANLEKMMELQERHEKNQARKAYHVAMADFKKDPPDLKKTKHVDYTTKTGNRVVYDHADLGEITSAIGKGLAAHGLSAAWKVDQDGGVKVTCTITHELGYSESTSMFAPPDTSGGKSSIQAIASANTYLQRYTLFALTGLAAHDQDDDGKGADPQPKGKAQTGEKPFLKPGDKNWESAKASYVDHNKSFEGIFKHVQMTEEHQKLMAEECKNA